MYKDGPRTERIKIFLMAADPYHRYSNGANLQMYDDFKLKKKPLVPMVYTKILYCYKGSLLILASTFSATTSCV